ncbi:MAG TPA: ABC transporter ATP-binding protein [Usitatibacter sp.]|nr:ABC transporter ATP-binding protein [Usitatibacter sp.]
MTVLDARGVNVVYRRADGGAMRAVIDASLSLAEGESLGIVGESGSGKSTLARALMGYCRPGGTITSGDIRLEGRDIRALARGEGRALRGGRIAFVPQNPLASLTPHMRVGAQVAEAVRIHRGCDAREARRATLELFEATRLPDPATLYERFPHELSGGQRQRVVISAALAGSPRLVILDEPTTALDKTTEAQVLDLVQSLRARLGAALIYVSHDLHVISAMCERVLVMLRGEVVEEGPTPRVYREPRHDYTRRLIAAVPRLDGPGAQPSRAAATGPLLRLDNVGYTYPSRKRWFRRTDAGRPALQGLSLEIGRGETVGLVGESGSGKSTAAAIVAGLLAPQAGTLAYAAQPLAGLARDRTPELRRRIQIIFQDPLSSLNPRQRVDAILARPLALFHGLAGAAARARSLELMAQLQLEPELLDAYPRQLSGGQQQRVAIARAFAADPDLIICDEITSALDVSVQAQVLALLEGLQERSGTACLFISHDLGVIARVASRVVVLCDGITREAGATRTILHNPRDEYTRLLVAAARRGHENFADSPQALVAAS